MTIECPARIALVTGSATDPESIRNPRVRAHARESQTVSARARRGRKDARIPALTIIEAEAFAKGAVALKKTPDALKHEGRSMTMMTCSAGHMPVRIGTTEQSN
jgi:hypothetical protein